MHVLTLSFKLGTMTEIAINRTHFILPKFIFYAKGFVKYTVTTDIILYIVALGG